MSVTNNNVIYDALKLLGVVAEGGSVTGEQGSDALRRLNQVMEAWTEDGVDLGYFAQSLTTDTCPIPAWAEQGVTSKLAQRLQADYPSSQGPVWLFDNSQNGVGMILRKCLVEAMEGADMSHLPSGSGHLGGWVDITQ